MVSNAWASFGVLLSLSLLWPCMTRNGALAGMVVVSLLDKAPLKQMQATHAEVEREIAACGGEI